MSTRKMLPAAGIIMVAVLLIKTWSCTHDPSLENIPEICFERDILPVFLNNCALPACHDGTGESDKVFTGYQAIRQDVEPGNPGSSEIYKAITATSGENKMPPDMPLSLENRTKIRLWILQGAVPSTCPEIK